MSGSKRSNVKEENRILVTGATGYVGGRLVPRLLEEGWRVRVLVRNPDRLRTAPWAKRVEIAVGDALQPDSIAPALAGVHSAYYLIHSMKRGEDFHRRDLQAADIFGTAAQRANVGRIIYLGGLGDPDSDLSPHLRSRQATGETLRLSGVQVLEFRAGIVVGAGSTSFEMVRYLTEHVPIMICPRWVFTKTQPIGVDDLLDYLVAALELEHEHNAVIEIGGPEVLSYADMLRGYARARGLRRTILPVPVLTPRLSSYWVHWVTPVAASIAQPLIEGLRNEVVLRSDLARTLFPNIEPRGYDKALQQALESLKSGDHESVLQSIGQGQASGRTIVHRQGMIIEVDALQTSSTPARLYATFTELGGERGWLYADWAWKLRELLDGALGGVGQKHTAPSPGEMNIGDSIDSWRVDHLKVNEAMHLRSEMKLPGEAWLKFTTTQHPSAGVMFTQTSVFIPRGLLGLVYWRLLYPFHRRIFSGLAHALVRAAESSSEKTVGGRT